jgi:hypothetical protein
VTPSPLVIATGGAIAVAVELVPRVARPCPVLALAASLAAFRIGNRKPRAADLR